MSDKQYMDELKAKEEEKPKKLPFFTRLREALSAFHTVLMVRKSCENRPLAVVLEEEMQEEHRWLAVRDYENQLMQKCITDTTAEGGYKSICEYCEEHRIGECKRPQYMKKGCKDWWLRFLTDEENAACEARAQGIKIEKKEEETDEADSAAEDTAPDPGMET